jgi:uncharacterized membrane protein YgcG
MDILRVLKHLLYPDWLGRRAFPPAAMAHIEAAIAASEARHRGEIRFAVEPNLPLLPLLRGQSARDRALEVFAQLRVWDTEENNGVLIYLLLADRDVEILADRGPARLVQPADWEGICRKMEARFRAGRYEEGVLLGIAEIDRRLARLYPRVEEDANELPDRPVRL